MKKCIFWGIYFISCYFGAANAANWPDCISEGIDYTGDNVISGLRFSNEECALWCQRVSYLKTKVPVLIICKVVLEGCVNSTLGYYNNNPGVSSCHLLERLYSHHSIIRLVLWAESAVHS